MIKIRIIKRGAAPICYAKGCDQPVKSEGLCEEHAFKKKLTGSPTGRIRGSRFTPCTVENCARPGGIDGLCQAHNNLRLLKAKLSPKPTKCTVAGCTRDSFIAGLCFRHHRKQHGPKIDITPAPSKEDEKPSPKIEVAPAPSKQAVKPKDEKPAPRPVQPKPKCSVDGCTRQSETRGLCGLHYDRLRKHGTTDDPAPRPVKPKRNCTVDGCDREGVTQGLCMMHYNRLRKHGTVGSAAPYVTQQVRNPIKVIGVLQHDNLEDPVEGIRCSNLWRNVLWQALADAMDYAASSIPETKAKAKNIANAMRASREWFDPFNRDFVMVCDLADLDPNGIADNAKRAIARHDMLTRLQRLSRGWSKTSNHALGTGAGSREKAFEGAISAQEGL